MPQFSFNLPGSVQSVTLETDLQTVESVVAKLKSEGVIVGKLKAVAGHPSPGGREMAVFAGHVISVVKSGE
jgi:hypothetical protein